MPIANPLQARDEMFGLFNTGWAIADLADPKPPIRWQGFEKGAVPETDFVRVSIQNAKQVQGGFLSYEDPGPSKICYDASGLVFVQVFALRSKADSYRLGERMAIEARNIFRGIQTPNGVWFRNCRYEELAPEEKFYRWKVTAEFEYTENASANTIQAPEATNWQA
jgi:hypothetical protein